MQFRKKHLFMLALCVLIFLSLGSFTPHADAQPAPYDWMQFNFDEQHTGNNTQETLITLDNVSHLKRLFQMKLDGARLAIADGAPVYLSGVQTPRGQRNMLFVTTMAGDIIAVDALTGEQLWIHHNPPLMLCTVKFNGVPCYTTSDPAIDPTRQFVYSYGIDGYVHKYQVGDGTEILDGGWPELATTKSRVEKGSSALSTVTDKAGDSYLYMPSSGYPGDLGDYQGHLTTINLQTGTQHVFNALCGDEVDVHFWYDRDPDCALDQSGAFGRPGVVYDPDNDEIYFTTGNGTFDPAHFDWGDTVLALHPDGTGISAGVPIDSYTPADQDVLDSNDLDLGSATPAILPALNNHHYAVQGGKDADLRIIDLNNLSGKRGPGNLGGEIPGSIVQIPQNEQILTQPAVWTNPEDGVTWVIVGTIVGISGFPLNADGSSWGTPWLVKPGCSSPIIANGVMFCAGKDQIKAFDPTTGEEKWNDTIDTIHWQSPIVVNGVLYITDNADQITAYALDVP